MASTSTLHAGPPLVARSPDGSLVALHQPGGSTIRCYDGNASGGSLKFTLRVGGGAGTSGDGPVPPAVRKLVFASSGPGGTAATSSAHPPPTLLCAVTGRSAVVLFDLGRGVASQTVDVRDAGGDGSRSKKSKKKSKRAAEANAVVADASSAPGRLDVLVRLPDADGGTPGKCRLYQYDLSGGDGRQAARLVRKVRVGSVPAGNDGGPPPAFGVASSLDGGAAVRLAGRVRTFDAAGGKLAGLDLPDELLLAPAGGDADGGDGADGEFDEISPLLWDGGRLVACSGRRVLVMSQRGDGDGDGGSTIDVEELLEADSGGTTTALDAEGTDLVAFSGGSGAASLFALGGGAARGEAGGLVPVPPRATARIDASSGRKASLVSAGFARRRGGGSGGARELQFLFRNGGGAAGSAASLPAETAEVAGLEGTVAVGGSLAEEAGGSRKRRQRADGGGAALAPGEQGQEADGAADLTLAKRARRGEEGEERANEEDKDEGNDEGDDEKERSIAERLAMLSSAMERSDTEDDDEDDDDEGGPEAPAAAAGFRARSATSATLTALLSQALGSGDPAQLNAALQVTDRRVVAGTVRSLQAIDAARDGDGGDEGDGAAGGLVPALMGHIVRRVARRHTLVMPLGVWIREVLAATARTATSAQSSGRMAEDARDMAAKLGPLRNFLSERVECLPQLLRLEGRLALLGDQQL